MPIDDREQPLLFHGRTLDFQDVTVQATVTYRVGDPALAAARIDFGIDPDRGAWQAAPLEQLGGLLTELAQQHALDLLAGMTLTQALAEGMTAVRERIAGGLAADPRLADTGVAVVDVRVVAVRAEPEVERALQTPTREQVQQEADRATYQRRALAVERERAIAENELQNQIELARREEQLVAQRGQNERKRATEQAAAEWTRAEAKAGEQRLLADARADATRAVGMAEAEAEAARLAPYLDLDAATILGLAVKELAGNLPPIGTLTLTPDLLTPVLARLGTGPAGHQERGVTLAPRAVMVHRRSELDELVAHHGTHQQAAFFLASRGRTLEEVDARHVAQQAALTLVAGAIPLEWRRAQVERGDLDRFMFGPEDVVVAVGQDGLVANVAKYLSGQPVIGVNPEPGRNPGVLVPHPPEAIGALLAAAVAADVGGRLQARTMVEASTDDGQSLLALNEVYVGHPSHQSARYRVEAPDGRAERQSSSGVLVGTGTGATGWCRSVWLERHSPLRLPDPADGRLCWFVREAWPSPATGTDCTEGILEPGQQLVVVAESDLVLFGDGIERDALSVTWGQRATLTAARRRLHLLV